MFCYKIVYRSVYSQNYSGQLWRLLHNNNNEREKCNNSLLTDGITSFITRYYYIHATLKINTKFIYLLLTIFSIVFTKVHYYTLLFVCISFLFFFYLLRLFSNTRTSNCVYTIFTKSFEKNPLFKFINFHVKKYVNIKNICILIFSRISIKKFPRLFKVFFFLTIFI